MPKVPQRTAGLSRSGIREVMDLAWASPEPVVRLEVGQPDAAPPDHVLAAMIAAVERKETGYTPNAGLPGLRHACAAKLARVNGIDRDPEDVMVSAGSMQGLMSVILGLVEPGQEVLVPDPGWPNHAMATRIASAVPVPYVLTPGNDYLPDFDRLAEQVTGRTRMVVVNSPSNPLGSVWGAEVMDAWVAFAAAHDLWILSDECYDEIAFDCDVVSPASRPGAEDRVVCVHSFSKTYAMTGLRVGYVSGSPEVMSTLIKMQEATVACVNGPAQAAAIAALEGPQEFVTARCAIYRERRDHAVAVAGELGLSHFVPSGAFYLWLPLGERIGPSMAFCARLVTDHQVALAPGETFGASGAGALRVSLANTTENIEVGLRRIAQALTS